MWVSEGVITDIIRETHQFKTNEMVVKLKVNRIRESTEDYFGDGRVKQASTTISVINRVTKVEA